MVAVEVGSERVAPEMLVVFVVVFVVVTVNALPPKIVVDVFVVGTVTVEVVVVGAGLNPVFVRKHAIKFAQSLFISDKAAYSYSNLQGCSPLVDRSRVSHVWRSPQRLGKHLAGKASI